MNNTPNISGTNGKLLSVTEEELAKHNKRTDCWTAISGNEHEVEEFHLRQVETLQAMSTTSRPTWIIILVESMKL